MDMDTTLSRSSYALDIAAYPKPARNVNVNVNAIVVALYASLGVRYFLLSSRASAGATAIGLAHRCLYALEAWRAGRHRKRWTVSKP